MLPADEYPNDVVDAYALDLRTRGVDRCVVVHPEPYGDDHSVIEHILERRPDWLGTSLFYPWDAEAPTKLAALVQRQPRIVSTRFHAHRGKSEYLKSFDEPGVRALWQKAVDLGLIIELHIGPAGDVEGAPPFGEQIAAVLRDIPASVVLIDHLAEAGMGTAPEMASILELGRFPNVYMKLSGPPRHHACTPAPLSSASLERVAPTILVVLDLASAPCSMHAACVLSLEVYVYSNTI